MFELNRKELLNINGGHWWNDLGKSFSDAAWNIDKKALGTIAWNVAKNAISDLV